MTSQRGNGIGAAENDPVVLVNFRGCATKRTGIRWRRNFDHGKQNDPSAGLAQGPRQFLCLMSGARDHDATPGRARSCSVGADGFEDLSGAFRKKLRCEISSHLFRVVYRTFGLAAHDPGSVGRSLPRLRNRSDLFERRRRRPPGAGSLRPVRLARCARRRPRVRTVHGSSAAQITRASPSSRV